MSELGYSWAVVVGSTSLLLPLSFALQGADAVPQQSQRQALLTRIERSHPCGLSRSHISISLYKTLGL